MLYAVLVVALVVLDQVVKFLVRANIPLGGDVPFLPIFSISPMCRTPARPSPCWRSTPGF